MRASEVRIEPQSLLQLRDGIEKARAVASIKNGCGLEKERVGIGAVRRGFHQPRLLLALQHDFELIGDGARNSFLQTEHIAEIAIVSFRPKMEAIGGLDQLRGDADLFSLLTDRTFENVGHAERCADAAQICVFAAEGE